MDEDRNDSSKAELEHEAEDESDRDEQEKKKRKKSDDQGIGIGSIPTWPQYYEDNKYNFFKQKIRTVDDEQTFQVNKILNDKVSLWIGDITKLNIDAIVNAANKTLLGGGGVDGCIHRAAGPDLLKECRSLNGCDTGKAKITEGYNLPSKRVIHTVGPMEEKKQKLKNCYDNCLNLAVENSIKTLAFCCISTGIYGYPNENAAEVALSTTRQWLEKENNAEKIDRIIFCLFLDKDRKFYEKLIPKYFPIERPVEETSKEKAHTLTEKDEKAKQKELHKKGGKGTKKKRETLTDDTKLNLDGTEDGQKCQKGEKDSILPKTSAPSGEDSSNVSNSKEMQITDEVDPKKMANDPVDKVKQNDGNILISKNKLDSDEENKEKEKLKGDEDVEMSEEKSQLKQDEKTNIEKENEKMEDVEQQHQDKEGKDINMDAKVNQMHDTEEGLPKIQQDGEEQMLQTYV